MVKNEWYVEISTLVGSITFVPHFTTVNCPVVKDVGLWKRNKLTNAKTRKIP
jgi:hypothetical protein